MGALLTLPAGKKSSPAETQAMLASGPVEATNKVNGVVSSAVTLTISADGKTLRRGAGTWTPAGNKFRPGPRSTTVYNRVPRTGAGPLAPLSAGKSERRARIEFILREFAL